MMATTHGFVGLAVAAAVATVSPELAVPAAIGGIAGGIAPDLDVLAAHRANIYAIQHDRTSRNIAMNDAEVELALETRGPDHVDDLTGALEDAGYGVEILL